LNSGTEEEKDHLCIWREHISHTAVLVANTFNLISTKSKNRNRNRDKSNKNKMNKDFRAEDGGRETKFQNLEFTEAQQQKSETGAKERGKD
jgi:hypothetical protein